MPTSLEHKERMLKPLPIIAAGQKIVPDDGFECLTVGQVCVIENDDAGNLFVPCRAGRHYVRKIKHNSDCELYGFTLADNPGVTQEVG